MRLKLSERSYMGVKGDNSSLRGPGAEPMAEGEAEPHKRSRRRSGQNALR